jgi:hypothetical protein
VTIKRVLVHSVRREPSGKSISVMTYQIVKNSLMFGAVYFGDLLPPARAADLHHDDLLSVVGVVFSFDPSFDGPKDVVEADGICIFGVVVPSPKNWPTQGR